MIRQYNRTQILLAVINLSLAVLAFGALYYLSYFAIRLLEWNWKFGLSEQRSMLIALGVVIVFSALGWMRVRSGKGHYAFQESDLFAAYREESAGAYSVDRYARRVTAPAYLVAQIALAGPLQFSKATGRMKSLVPNTAENLDYLNSLLAEMRAVGGWQDIARYTGREKEIAYLIRMKQVEFSPRKGTVRAAA